MLTIVALLCLPQTSVVRARLAALVVSGCLATCAFKDSVVGLAVRRSISAGGVARQQPRANCPRIRTDIARSLRMWSLLFCNAASSSFAVKRAESCVEFFSTACTAVLAGVLLFWICRFAVSAAAFCCVRFVHVPTVSVSNCRTVLVLVRD